MKANDTRAKGMVFNQKAGEYIQELEAELAALKEAAQAEVDRQRHQCGMLEADIAWDIVNELTEKIERLTIERDQSVRRVSEVNKFRRQELQAYEGEIKEHKAHNGRVVANNEGLEKDIERLEGNNRKLRAALQRARDERIALAERVRKWEEFVR